MKTTKYGYSTFNKKTDLSFAVIVPLYETGQADGRGAIKSVEWRFVTEVEYLPHKTWKAEKGKKAKLWSDRKSAQDFVIGLAWNFTTGYVVEVLEDMCPSNSK